MGGLEFVPLPLCALTGLHCEQLSTPLPEQKASLLFIPVPFLVDLVPFTLHNLKGGDKIRRKVPPS